MTDRCPDCRVDLVHERIGGTRSPKGKTTPRLVLLCVRCWRVWPADNPPRPHLALVDTRRDLA